MRIHYTGKLEKLDAASQKKLESRYARLGKLLDKKAEKEAHVILTKERHLQRAEVTVTFAGRQVASFHAAADHLTALIGACDRLEKQIQKVHDKSIGKRRENGKEAGSAESDGAAEKPAKPSAKIYRISEKSSKKPMTVEEAVLEVSDRKPYIVYRDADAGHLSVLIRRADGHFDLLEAEQ